MSKLINLIVIFCSVAFLVGTVVGASFVWDAFFRAPGKNDTETVLTVVSGEGFSDISRSLKESNLIPSRLGFRFYVKLVKAENNLQPGEFTLSTGMNYASILAALTIAAPDEVTITFPEGLTSEQMTERIDTAFGEGWGENWLRTLNDSQWQETFLFLLNKHVDGYLFPDTYRVSRSGFPDDLTYKLLTNFSEKLTPELRVEISRQGKTIHEVITLASILEKEVRSDEDRALVADLFWRRLGIGMALQADSTVHFVVGSDGSTVYTSETDRSVDSPYNTYKYPGLPPGPICNPSLSSIKAVIYPETNNAWYFLTDNEGVVHYASTNDGQNENKALYLQ